VCGEESGHLTLAIEVIMIKVIPTAKDGGGKGGGWQLAKHHRQSVRAMPPSSGLMSKITEPVSREFFRVLQWSGVYKFQVQ
jgi:hypothetical protein